MKYTATIEINGHIIDSLTLPKIMDIILDENANYEIDEIKIGREKTELSYARLNISAEDQEILNNVLKKVTKQGAVLIGDGEEEVRLEICPKDRTLPDNFYSTTNLPTQILLNKKWIPVENTAMDCVIVVEKTNKRAFCKKISQVKQGEVIVTGYKGIKVSPARKHKENSSFSFMSSEVSTEKPKSLMIKKIAKRMAEIKKNNEGKILFVLGPAVVHTKSQDFFTKLIELGYVDCLFAGNALATHDLEVAFFGTSLGVSFEDGSPVSGGHSHHLRAINKIYQHGSIAQAVNSGELKSGIMHSCIKNNIDFVLAGSIRDDGPLPEVITDSVTAQCIMREKLQNVKMVVMVATMLHSIAVGNLLPAEVDTVCVDMNPSVITKLSDRGSFQTIGLVTDVESFLSSLVRNLTREKDYENKNIYVST